MRSLLMDFAFQFLKMCILFFFFVTTLWFVLVIYPPALIPIGILCAVIPIGYVKYTYRHPTREDVLLLLDDVYWRSVREINIMLRHRKYYTKQTIVLIQELEIEAKIERKRIGRDKYSVTYTVTDADRFRRKTEERDIPRSRSAPVPLEAAPAGFY